MTGQERTPTTRSALEAAYSELKRLRQFVEAEERRINGFDAGCGWRHVVRSGTDKKQLVEVAHVRIVVMPGLVANAV